MLQSAIDRLLRIASSALLVAVGACAGPNDGRWVGPVTPETAACGPATRGLLEAAHGEVVFTPSEGVLILRGHVAGDGTIQAEATTAGQSHQTIVTSFSGKVTNGGVDGTLTQQGCTSRVELKRG